MRGKSTFLRIRITAMALAAVSLAAARLWIGDGPATEHQTRTIQASAAPASRGGPELEDADTFPGEERFRRGATVSHRTQCVYQIAHSSVQEEIDLTDEQREQIQPLIDEGYTIMLKTFASALPEDPLEMAGPVEPYAERCAAVFESVLTDEQFTRLRQCAFQSEEGAILFFHPLVIDELQLSREQRQQISERLTRLHKEIAPYRHNPLMSFKVKRLVAECRAETEQMLSDEQRAALDDLLGEPAPE